MEVKGKRGKGEEREDIDEGKDFKKTNENERVMDNREGVDKWNNGKEKNSRKQWCRKHNDFLIGDTPLGEIKWGIQAGHSRNSYHPSSISDAHRHLFTFPEVHLFRIGLSYLRCRQCCTFVLF